MSPHVLCTAAVTTGNHDRFTLAMVHSMKQQQQLLPAYATAQQAQQHATPSHPAT
jgi:hypothetical protein